MNKPNRFLCFFNASELAKLASGFSVTTELLDAMAPERALYMEMVSALDNYADRFARLALEDGDDRALN